MNTRKSWSIVVALVFVTILLFIGFSFRSALAQKTIEWKVIVGWTTENASVRVNFVQFVEKVNKRAEGKFKISWLGPEAVPPFEQLKPVREGLFDATFTAPAYHMGEVPVSNAMYFFAAPGKEIRKAGLVNMMDEIYKKKANVFNLMAVTTGVGFNIMLRKKIDKADLTGLKIRTSPFYDPLVKALGGSPVRIAGGEIYSALEKGVVDGTCWPAVGALDYKWYEVAKCQLRPTYGEDINLLLVNLNSWNRLPKDIQGLLTKTAIEVEEEGRATYMAMLEKEEKDLQKLGVEIVVLPPKEAEKYLNAFYTQGWDELVTKPDPEFASRLKATLDKMRKK
jgi:TRAP-type C4-dicarboxylate transport system substrate-binding protein